MIKWGSYLHDDDPVEAKRIVNKKDYETLLSVACFFDAPQIVEWLLRDELNVENYFQLPCNVTLLRLFIRYTKHFSLDAALECALEHDYNNDYVNVLLFHGAEPYKTDPDYVWNLYYKYKRAKENAFHVLCATKQNDALRYVGRYIARSVWVFSFI